MIDFVTATKYQDQVFRLVTREEISRTAYGKTIGKRLGSAIWTVEYTTWPIPNDDALAFEAQLNSLDGVTGVFEAADLRRLEPRAYSNGGASDGEILTVNANNKAMSLSDLNAGQVVSAGDYLAFGTAFHQVMQTVTANGSGTTAEFEVRPHIRPGWTVGTVVKLSQPRCQFSLMPDSIQPRANGGLHTVISFKAVQAI